VTEWPVPSVPPTREREDVGTHVDDVEIRERSVWKALP
jgi:hypothetical protein